MISFVDILALKMSLEKSETDATGNASADLCS